MKKFQIVTVLLAFVLTTHLFAFPELVRRGYGNCIVCHYSPTGGGLLTAYGRALTSEVLTARGTPDEGQFLYGLFHLPEPVALGGDFRFLGSIMNSSHGVATNLIPMQMDLEAAATVGKFTVDATGGMDNNSNPISRRHYLIYKPTDELSFRAGRFMPAYGINTEDHALAIKQGIGQDQGAETYNLEAAWLGENWNFYLTGIFGRPDNPNLGAETGASASASLYFADRYKVGISYYYGYRPVATRQLMGPFAILGFTPHFFMLAELDFQWLSTQGGLGSQWGPVDYVRLDYEVIQGLHFYLTQELSKLFINYDPSYNDAYGIGVQFFPRPHYEINALYQKMRVGGSSAAFSDFLWCLAHVYL